MLPKSYRCCETQWQDSDKSTRVADTLHGKALTITPPAQTRQRRRMEKEGEVGLGIIGEVTKIMCVRID